MSFIGVVYYSNIGAYKFPMATLSIVMGRHVKVRLKDNVFLKKGVLVRSNAELVEKVVRTAKEFDREIATVLTLRHFHNF